MAHRTVQSVRVSVCYQPRTVHYGACENSGLALDESRESISNNLAHAAMLGSSGNVIKERVTAKEFLHQPVTSSPRYSLTHVR